MSWNDLPGLGTATGTRVDSAAKHIMACKMDTKLLQAMLENNDDPQNSLHNEKMKYCMHKDEIVLNTTNTEQNVVTAYPMVVTTLGDVDEAVTKIIARLYAHEDATTFFDYQRKMKIVKDSADIKSLILDDTYKDPTNPNQISRQRMQIRMLPDFRCQGVALGQAWASYLSGDNVASVLVGGMVTVQNGHFVMHTGDLVQWYFDFEKDKFDQTNTKSAGRRVTKPKDSTRNDKRERYMDERLFGNSAKTGKTSGQKNTNNIVRIKSYKMHCVGQDSQLFVTDHFGDKIRIFAKCISGGRPFDAVDIMLMTQSL